MPTGLFMRGALRDYFWVSFVSFETFFCDRAQKIRLFFSIVTSVGQLKCSNKPPCIRTDHGKNAQSEFISHLPALSPSSSLRFLMLGPKNRSHILQRKITLFPSCPTSCPAQWLTTLLAVGASVSVLPPVLRKVLPERVIDLPVSAPFDAALAKAFPKVRTRTPPARLGVSHVPRYGHTRESSPLFVR